MEIIIGFCIAVAIGMTGVGAGTITAPTLILFLGMPLPMAVGTALIFGAAVKTIAVPVYWVRKQVNFRVLGFLLAGGLPGVIISSILLSRTGVGKQQGLMYGLLGIAIIITAGRTFFSAHSSRGEVLKDRSRWLPLVAAPIGLEVGFSSAGAGALGTSALMLMTPLTTAQVVGTDLFFGLALSVVGGGAHFAMGDFNSAMLLKLVSGGIAGAIVEPISPPKCPTGFSATRWLRGWSILDSNYAIEAGRAWPYSTRFCFDPDLWFYSDSNSGESPRLPAGLLDSANLKADGADSRMAAATVALANRRLNYAAVPVPRGSIPPILWSGNSRY